MAINPVSLTMVNVGEPTAMNQPFRFFRIASITPGTANVKAQVSDEGQQSGSNPGFPLTASPPSRLERPLQMTPWTQLALTSDTANTVVTGYWSLTDKYETDPVGAAGGTFSAAIVSPLDAFGYVETDVEAVGGTKVSGVQGTANNIPVIAETVSIDDSIGPIGTVSPFPSVGFDLIPFYGHSDYGGAAPVTNSILYGADPVGVQISIQADNRVGWSNGVNNGATALGTGVISNSDGFDHMAPEEIFGGFPSCGIGTVRVVVQTADVAVPLTFTDQNDYNVPIYDASTGLLVLTGIPAGAPTGSSYYIPCPGITTLNSVSAGNWSYAVGRCSALFKP